MARGHQKIQSQKKNAERKEAAKKSQGSDQKKAAQKSLVYTCVVCKAQIGDPKTYKMHFEAKHPKVELPAELKDVVDD